MATRNRWMEWKPNLRISPELTESEPTKPSKLGSVGFEGILPADSPEIGEAPDQTELDHACAVLNDTGTRIMVLGGVTTIGVWRVSDGPAIRTALAVLRMDQLPIRHLDEDAIPSRYKGGANPSLLERFEQCWKTSK